MVLRPRARRLSDPPAMTNDHLACSLGYGISLSLAMKIIPILSYISAAALAHHGRSGMIRLHAEGAET